MQANREQTDTNYRLKMQNSDIRARLTIFVQKYQEVRLATCTLIPVVSIKKLKFYKIRSFKIQKENSVLWLNLSYIAFINI